MLRKILVSCILVGVVVGLYLTFPLHWFLSSEKNPIQIELPISLARNDDNGGKRCEANRTYVSERVRYIHENEGYEFIVNDYCADLQRRLIGSIGNEDLAEVRKLISLGANPDTADVSTFQGVRPLMVAASRDPAIVTMLLDNGAVVNEEYCCCAMCQSPLTRAIQGRRADTVELLLERGADIGYKPSWGDVETVSAFNQALQTGNSEIMQLAENACELNLQCRIGSRAKKVLRLAGIRP